MGESKRKKKVLKVDEDEYNQILAVWLRKQSVPFVASELGLSRALVAQVVEQGAPKLGLPPVSELTQPNSQGRRSDSEVNADGGRSSSGTTSSDMTLSARIVAANMEAEETVTKLKAQLAMLEREARESGQQANVAATHQALDGTLATFTAARERIALESVKIEGITQAAVNADTAGRSADEAAMARQAMKTTLAMSAIMSHMTDGMLQAIEEGRMILPSYISPRVLASMTASLDKMTSAMERAIKIEKGRAGESEKGLSVQIAILLDHCTDVELAEFKLTKQLPARLRMLSSEVPSD